MTDKLAPTQEVLVLAEQMQDRLQGVVDTINGERYMAGITRFPIEYVSGMNPLTESTRLALEHILLPDTPTDQEKKDIHAAIFGGPMSRTANGIGSVRAKGGLLLERKPPVSPTEQPTLYLTYTPRNRRVA